jgi:signal transduction histidine kinase
LLVPFDTTAVLFVALRRAGAIIGVHSAGYRGARAAFGAPQERIMRGIAQLASFALENARLFEEVESANRFRSDFVATMSHELRTPLSVVLGYHDLLLEGAYTDLLPEQAETLRRANKSARELLDLITATLDLSRFESRIVPAAREAVSVQALVEGLAADAQLLANNPDLKLEWDVPTQPLVLMTDPVQLRMVLKNLIGNAIKFTDRGRVRIVARPSDGGVEFRVSDTGIGIPPEALEFIFEPFRQADSSRTRRAKGAGLGLYIVRRLLDALGGTIDVQSTVGKGSTFRVWLPLRVSEEKS